MKKSLKLLIAGFIMGAVMTGCSGAKDYVATVNGNKITQDEYKYFLMAARNNIEQSAGVQDEESRKALWEGNLGEKSAEEYTKELALENAKEFKILMEKANAAGFKVDDKDIEAVNTEIDSYVETLGAGDEGKKKYEETYGVSVELVKKINKDLTLVQKFYEDQLGKVESTDEEVKKYYEENADTYKQVTVKHVLFMTIDQTTGAALPQDKQDEAKKKAEGILNRVKSGEDIAALATQYSEDGGSKANGGEYTFPKGKMVEEFENWSFNAKVGDVGLVQTNYGYHVIRLEKVSSFDDVKDNVKSDFAYKKYNDELELVKKDAKYEIKKNSSVYDTIKIF